MSDKKINLKLDKEIDESVIKELSGPRQSQRTRNQALLHKLEIVLATTGIKNTDLDYTVLPTSSAYKRRLNISEERFPNVYRFCSMLPHGMLEIGLVNLIRRASKIIFSQSNDFDRLATDYFRGLSNTQSDTQPILDVPEVVEFGEDESVDEELKAYMNKSVELFGGIDDELI